MSRRWALPLLVLILLITLGMRLYRLDDLPPGLFHDEAYNTLDAKALAEGRPHPRFYDSWEVYARVVHSDWPPKTTRIPVFMEGNYGREALFHYLGALAILVFSPRVWSLRLVAAVAGVLSVLSSYLVGRQLFAYDESRSRRIGLLAAAISLGVYALLGFSRLALRIILLVALEGLTVAAWWRAARAGQFRWWLLAGGTLGLAQHTYIPARLLPLVLALPTAVWLVRTARVGHRDFWYFVRLMLMGLLVTGVVIAPLAVFYLRYPAYLTLRAEAIAADASEAGLPMIIANMGRVTWGLIGRGDPNPLLNLPGRPLFDPLQALFLLGGIYVCARRARLSQLISSKSGIVSHSFLLWWAALMHLPSIVSGVAPTFGRSIGGVLPLVVIVAVGMEAFWRSVALRWPSRRHWVTGGIALCLTVSVGLITRDYFVLWAQLPGLETLFHGDMARIGRYIGQLPRDATCYVTPTQKYYATLLLAMGDRERPRDFYGPTGVLPAGDPRHEVIYLILEGDDETANRISGIFPGGHWDVRDVLFDSYRVPSAPRRGYPEWQVNADFGDRIRLLGYERDDIYALSGEVRSGDTLTLTLAWQALSAGERRYTAFVHLVGDDDVPPNPATGSQLWSQDDHEPGQATYTTDRWFSGEVVIDRFILRVPPNTPSGVYSVTTGFYDSMTLMRLPRTDDRTSGDTVTLGTVVITGGGP